MIREGRLASYFIANTELNQYRPISFELRNARDNSIASISRTTEYDIKECDLVDTGGAIAIGQEMRIKLVNIDIPNACDSFIDQGDVYGNFSVKTYNPRTKSTDTITLYNRERKDAVGIANGTTWDFSGVEKTVLQYYPDPNEKKEVLTISAYLYVADTSNNHQIVGNWDNFNLSGRPLDRHLNAGATGNCGGDQPDLRFRLERLRYLY